MMSDFFRRFKQQTFSLRVNVTDSCPFYIDYFKVLKEINSNKYSLIINADPFLYSYKDILYLFYEEKNIDTPGVIKMTKSTDGKIWTDSVIIIKEDFHLSFPFVFEYEDHIYIIPESNADKSIRIYISNSDLSEWRFEKKILEGEHYRDSSIIRHNNTYYIFTTVIEKGEYVLKLFYSDSLFDKWSEHPKSPIARGMNIARNGGAVFLFENKLIRPVQYCFPYYGKGLGFCEIMTLSKNEYAEMLFMDNFYLKSIPFYNQGGHHFCITEFKGENVIATDRVRYSFSSRSIYNGIKRGVKKCLGIWG
ncbi:glycosyl transferase [Parabacteroides sp. APC149_11_2_Y6]